MSPVHLEELILAIEQHAGTVASALVSGEPQALLAASATLQQAAIDLSALMQQLSPVERKSKDLKVRLKKIAKGMALQRESLIRRTALVEMALNAVIPAAQSATYAKTTSPYGSAGKPSGSFKYLAA
jgi:hypothetical protein